MAGIKDFSLHHLLRRVAALEATEALESGGSGLESGSIYAAALAGNNAGPWLPTYGPLPLWMTYEDEFNQVTIPAGDYLITVDTEWRYTTPPTAGCAFVHAVPFPAGSFAITADMLPAGGSTNDISCGGTALSYAGGAFPVGVDITTVPFDQAVDLAYLQLNVTKLA